jgi:hypothetical protein
LIGFSAGEGVLTGSAFSIRFGGVSVAPVVFFTPGFGVGDSSGSGVGLFLTPGFFAGSGVSFDPVFFVCFGFGVGLFSTPGFFVGSGDSSASVESLRFGFGVDSSST